MRCLLHLYRAAFITFLISHFLNTTASSAAIEHLVYVCTSLLAVVTLLMVWWAWSHGHHIDGMLCGEDIFLYTDILKSQ